MISSGVSGFAWVEAVPNSTTSFLLPSRPTYARVFQANLVIPGFFGNLLKDLVRFTNERASAHSLITFTRGLDFNFAMQRTHRKMLYVTPRRRLTVRSLTEPRVSVVIVWAGEGEFTAWIHRHNTRAKRRQPPHLYHAPNPSCINSI